MRTEAKPGGLWKPVLMLAFGLAMIAGAYRLTTDWSHKTEVLKQQQEVLKQKREAFFAIEVPRLLDEEEKRNLAALNRARMQLTEVFARYEARVPEFVEKLTTWGVKYKLAKAALSDWWSETNEARSIATDIFADKVLSNQELTRDITRVVNQFISDLKANRNIMLSELTKRVETQAVPIAAGTNNLAGITTAFQEKLSVILGQRAVELPAIAALSFAGGFLAEEATRSLVTSVIRGLTARLAASAVARGGVAAGGAAVGSVAGPVGIAAGLAVGLAIDVWMERRFKEKVTGECNQILRAMQVEVWQEQKRQFELLIKTTRSIHEEALKKVILGGTE